MTDDIQRMIELNELYTANLREGGRLGQEWRQIWERMSLAERQELERLLQEKNDESN